jgi:SAM-dependent methyltransferase
MSYLIGETKWFSKLSAEDRELLPRQPFTQCSGPLLAQIGFVLTMLPKPPCRVLDAGCGGGTLSHILALSGYRVTGIDVCADVIKWLKRRSQYWVGHETIAIKFEWRDFDYMEIGEYDAIVFTGALHHSRNITKTLRSCFFALRPGGRLIAVEPGLGHASSSEAVRARMDFGLTENSTPPFKTAWHGWRAGFRGIRVYPHPFTLFKATYCREALAHNWLARLACRLPFSFAVFHLAKWAHGAIVMRKPL